jgi:hypothetical protein
MATPGAKETVEILRCWLLLVESWARGAKKDRPVSVGCVRTWYIINQGRKGGRRAPVFIYLAGTKSGQACRVAIYTGATRGALEKSLADWMEMPAPNSMCGIDP